MRKSSLFALLFVAAFLIPAAPARALVPGLEGNTLIKLVDDHDPKTTEDSAVYWFDRDWKRRPFPNQKVFKTWFKDFSGVQQLTKEQMAEFMLGKPVQYRPGSRLIKIPSIPKVFAVEPGGVIRWITSEAVAKQLYGNDWNKRVEDVSETQFTQYTEGPAMYVAAWPTGTVLRRNADGALYFIDGAYKRHLTPAVADGMAVRDPYIIPTDSDLSDYLDGGELLDGTQIKYRDAAQLSRLETLPPPQVDLPAVAAATAPSDAVLAEFRVTTGEPITVRRIPLTIEGELRSGGVKMLEHVRFVDSTGADVFGIQELADDAGVSQKFTFDGAWTLKAWTQGSIFLKANIHPLYPSDKLKVTVDRSGLRVADDAGRLIEGVFPRTPFAAATIEVKKAK